jgi:hypothetical protein
MLGSLFAPVQAIEAAMGCDFQVCLAQTRLDEGIKSALQEILAGVSLHNGCATPRSIGLACPCPTFCLSDDNRMRCYEGKHFNLLR